MQELLDLGVTSRLRGYSAVVEAMRLFDEDPMFLTETIQTYKELGKRLNMGWQNVERNIRTVIESGWKRNQPYMEQLMGCPLPKPPKAGEFLGTLYFYRKMHSA